MSELKYIEAIERLHDELARIKKDYETYRSDRPDVLRIGNVLEEVFGKAYPARSRAEWNQIAIRLLEKWSADSLVLALRCFT